MNNEKKLYNKSLLIICLSNEDSLFSVLVNQKYKQDMQKLEQEKLSADSKLKELNEQLHLTTDNIKSMQKEILEKSSKVLELENRKYLILLTIL